MNILGFLRPKSDHPDQHRKELILNTILGFCFLMILLFLLMVLDDDLQHRSYIGTFYFLLAISPFALAYYLSRKGRIRSASYIVISVFSGGLLYSAYSWGVILPTVLLGIALIGTCTSLLLNSRAGFIYAIAASAILISLQLMHGAGFHIPDYSWTISSPSIMDLAEYSILILFISGISWLSNRQTESALARAQNSEKELSIERDGLELKVMERTKALEYAQIEKTTEMYRFVEFGKLSAGLIHDLMSPLTSLCIETESRENSASNPAGDVADNSARIETLNTVIGASRKIQDIIQATRNQIKAEFNTERISIPRIIDEALLLHQSRIKKLDIAVRRSVPSSLYLDGSPSLLSHILTNLISNAIDAVEERAKKADSDSVLTLEIYAIRQPTFIRIIVRDNGIGIPDEILASIFDPFFTTKKHTGWGYGLSASRHIAQKYFGGGIEVERSDGQHKKTSFVLKIPLVR